jgi:hypothetical protein
MKHSLPTQGVSTGSGASAKPMEPDDPEPIFTRRGDE